MIWSSANKNLDLSSRAVIMGILNATPDSFSDGGKYLNPDKACQHALAMIAAGAEIIDIGGESTRPGAESVSAEEEIRRVTPVIQRLRQHWQGWISIDTTKASVAAQALAAGADIVNDISGLEADEKMPDLCREAKCAVVVMHRQGTPVTMQMNPHYENVIDEIRSYFLEKFNQLCTLGLSPSQLCFDPGIGFGKSVEHNWQIIQNLAAFHVADRPVLLGASRKSFIAKTIGINMLSARSWPSVALTAFGRSHGVMIHRVHEIKENLEAIRMIEAIQKHRLA